MSRYTNLSGYIKYSSEDELKAELEKLFFPSYFDNGWKPILDITKEVPPSPNSLKKIDYYGTISNSHIWVEIKNWWVTKKDLTQLSKYNRVLSRYGPKPFLLLLICGGIESERIAFLSSFNVAILLTRNIEKLDPKKVVYWM